MKNRNKILLVIFLFYSVETSVGVPTSEPNLTGAAGGFYAEKGPLLTNRVKQCEFSKFSITFGCVFQIYYQNMII